MYETVDKIHCISPALYLFHTFKTKSIFLLSSNYRIFYSSYVIISYIISNLYYNQPIFNAKSNLWTSIRPFLIPRAILQITCKTVPDNFASAKATFSHTLMMKLVNIKWKPIFFCVYDYFGFRVLLLSCHGEMIFLTEKIFSKVL